MRGVQAEVFADDPDDGVPNLPQGQVRMQGGCVAWWEVGLSGVGQT
ncbi:hypothetical protein MBT84_37630 [Streptomyces sp. MBT84]|nr:hypothetical protein [Streptomyces sp. MBT84]